MLVRCIDGGKGLPIVNGKLYKISSFLNSGMSYGVLEDNGVKMNYFLSSRFVIVSDILSRIKLFKKVLK